MVLGEFVDDTMEMHIQGDRDPSLAFKALIAKLIDLCTTFKEKHRDVFALMFGHVN